MLRVVIASLIALVLVWLFARSLGITPQQAEDRILLAQLNEEAGLAYRDANRQRPGVIVLADDLQVEILRHGEGAVPGPEDWVQVHYTGRHADGRVFETSRRLDRPATVPVVRTIPAWQRVLTQVETGSRLRLVAPPALAYGPAGSGPVGPNETLIFEIELLDIVTQPPAQVRDALQQPVPGL